jgi:xylulokinase
VVWHLTGTVATDATMASLTGCYAPDGQIVDHLAGMVGDRLPPVVPSDRVTGPLVAGAAEQLGLASGVPVVIGAGDRQCEVLGTGATGVVPMVSWGTTANVSLPVAVRPSPAPAGVVVSRAAADGWQLEGGVSAAGSLLGWLAGLCGRTPAELADLAAASPPGARGITAVPWLGGARAPWWRPGAGAAFVGLSGDHGPGDLARALYEAVASDIRRCLGRMAGDHGPGPEISALELTGGGASLPVWTEVLTGATGLPGRLRRSGQAASAGAALLAARAIGRSWDLEALDPVVRRFEVDPEIGRRYGELADHADRVAGALVDLGPPPPCG